jgi:hypothetical protein
MAHRSPDPVVVAMVRMLLITAAGVLALAPAADAATARTVARCDGARVAGGVARTVSGCGRVDLSGGPTAAAGTAIDRVAGALKVDAGELRPLQVVRTPGGARVRFQQYADGVPVHDGQVTVALADDGAVEHIANGAAPADEVDTGARIGRDEALLRARRRVPSGFDLVAPPTVRQIAEPRPGGKLELAWLVVLPVRAPRGDWNVIVSARTGDVLEAYDALDHFDSTGSALTWFPNPVQALGDTSLRDTPGQNPLPETRSRVTFGDLTDPGNHLIGTYVDTSAPGIVGCTRPYDPGQAVSPTHTYDYARSDPRFEEALAYAEIDRVGTTMAAFGFPTLFPGPASINVHCVGTDNSYFSPDDGGLHMGDGGVDDAEDGDIIVHELGHLLQNAQVPGFGPGGDTEQRAIGEGFGDTLAAYMHLQDGDPTYQAQRRFCVMDWDATSSNPLTATNPGGGCARWVDGTNEADGSDIGTYNGTPSEVHDDGRYWSAMVTCVFKGIEPALGTEQARQRILTLVVAHNYDLVPTEASTAFAASLDALRAEDTARFNGDEVQLISQCGQQRLGVAAARDATPPVVTGTLTPAGPDGANGWYRTSPTVAWQVSDRESAVQLAGCQQGTDPADTAGRTITCTATSEGGVTAKSLSYRKDGRPPSLAPELSLGTVRVGQELSVAPDAADATSGVAAQSCDTPDTSTRGAHTVTCRATDNAGNTAQQVVPYTVAPRQTFTGSKPKVSSRGVTFRLRSNAGGQVIITAKAGRTRFRKLTTRLTADRAKKVTLRLAKSSRARFARSLRGGRRVKIKLTIAPAAGGGKRHLTLKVRR